MGFSAVSVSLWLNSNMADVKTVRLTEAVKAAG